MKRSTVVPGVNVRTGDARVSFRGKPERRLWTGFAVVPAPPAKSQSERQSAQSAMYQTADMTSVSAIVCMVCYFVHADRRSRC